VFADVVIIISSCVIIGIGIVIGIVVWQFVVCCTNILWMLPFSASRSMRCGGGVMDRGGRGIGVVLVGSGGGVVGGHLVNVGSQSMGF